MKPLIISIFIVLLLWVIAHAETFAITWDANTDYVEGYKVYLHTAGTAGYVCYTTIPARPFQNVTGYVRNLDSQNGRYVFAVTAFYNISGGISESGYSKWLRVNLLPNKSTAGGTASMSGGNGL